MAGDNIVAELLICSSCSRYAALADDSPLHSFVTAVDKMGYVARDLQALLIRAHHQAIIDDTATGEVDLQSEWCCEPRDPTASDAPIPLKLAHFVSAVAGFTPASLRGVKLQEVEVGLDKVGAMNDVKSVLLETMLWPSKFVELRCCAVVTNTHWPFSGILACSPRHLYDCAPVCSCTGRQVAAKLSLLEPPPSIATYGSSRSQDRSCSASTTCVCRVI